MITEKEGFITYFQYSTVTGHVVSTLSAVRGSVVATETTAINLAHLGAADSFSVISRSPSSTPTALSSPSDEQEETSSSIL